MIYEANVDARSRAARSSARASSTTSTIAEPAPTATSSSTGSRSKARSASPRATRCARGSWCASPTRLRPRRACATSRRSFGRRAFRRPLDGRRGRRAGRRCRSAALAAGDDIETATRADAARDADVAALRVPRRARSRSGVGRAARAHRSRARVAAVVLPVEQHARRRAARRSPTPACCKTRTRAARAGAAHAAGRRRPRRCSTTSPASGCSSARSTTTSPTTRPSRLRRRRCARAMRTETELLLPRVPVRRRDAWTAC